MHHRTLIKLLFVFAILTLAAAPSMAQQIQGDVRYAANSQPAFGILVHSSGTGGTSEQQTDRNGKFYFRVSPGHYTITVRVPGYKEEVRAVDMTEAQQSEYISFRLKDDGSGAKPTTGNAPDPNAVPAKAREEFDQGAAIINEGKKERMPEGIAHLEKAVSLYPTYLQAHLMLGTTYMDLQQWDKAEKALRRALEINPKAANAYFALGEVYLRQKKYDQAEKALLEGIAIEARSPQSHLTLARVYWERVSGVKDEAVWRPPLEKSYEEVKQALALDPNLAAAHLLKGNLLFKVRRAEDALHEFEEYLRLDPQGQLAEQTRALAERIRKALTQEKKP